MPEVQYTKVEQAYIDAQDAIKTIAHFYFMMLQRDVISCEESRALVKERERQRSELKRVFDIDNDRRKIYLEGK